VLWAAVRATVFFPLQRRYVAGLGGRMSLAALATILTIIGLVVVPLFLVGLAMSREAIQLHELITSGAIDLQAPLPAVGPAWCGAPRPSSSSGSATS
jgi:predicted PurR-regulated permease PerM